MDRIELPADAHIAGADLQVSSLEKALSFYRDRLGFRSIYVSDGEARLSASGEPPYHLRLVERNGARPKPAYSTGLFHLAIRLPDRTSLADLLLHMIVTRTEIQGASDHLVSEAIYLADPEGNGLELYVDRPREMWPRSGDQIEMATRPLDLDDLLNQAKTDEAGWQGINPGTDIGHIHLQVADLDQTEAFYHTLLGFRVTQRSYPGALFFAADEYHHHIGTNTWNCRGAPPPPPEAVGLVAYRIDIPGQAYKEQVIRQLEAGKIDYEVRSNAENGNSLLIRDPSANLVEMIFDLTKID